MKKSRGFKKRLTTTYLDKLKDNIDLLITDTEIPCFYLRYGHKTNSKVFYLWYRTRFTKKERNMKVGRYPDYSIKEARRLALKYRHIIAEGGDPVLELKEQIKINQIKEEKRIKVKILLEKYLEEYSSRHKKPSTYKNEKSLYKKSLRKAIGNIPITELNLKHLNKLNDTLGEESHSKANHAIALISHFLNWCEKFGYRNINSNPCKLIKKYKLQGRDRVLSHDEYKRMFKALNKGKELSIYSPFAFDVMKFLALTGCRLSEAKNLTWEEVDLDNQLLRLKDSKTGAKAVPIGKPALEILKEALKEKSSNYVFPSSKRKGTPLVDLRRPWTFIKKEASLDGLRLHDLRHSFATMGSMTGENMAVIGSVLGHRQITTTQRYTHINNLRGIEAANNIADKIMNHSE